MKRNYYKKSRKARSFRKKTPVRSSLLSKQLAVMYNPFSTATDTPKVPDGQLTNSLGERLNFVFEFDKSSLQITGDNFVATCVLAATPKFLMTAQGTFSGAPLRFVNKNGNFVDTLVGIEPWLNQLSESAQIRKVRMVSIGYRFALMNNSDNNEGWFMAARNDNLSTGPLYTDPQVCNGFVAGKLRDIHKYQFTLHPNGRVFPFLGKALADPVDVNVDPVHYIEEEDRFSTKTSQTSGFDTISLKISGGADTKLMCHVSANIEFTIERDQALYRYQTSCIAQPNVVDAIIPKLRADGRAAVPFTGSFPLA